MVTMEASVSLRKTSPDRSSIAGTRSVLRNTTFLLKKKLRNSQSEKKISQLTEDQEHHVTNAENEFPMATVTNQF